MNRYLLALVICAGMAAFEGVCAGRDPMKQLRDLHQPRWSPPPIVWIVIGILWYAICFTALVRLLPTDDRTVSPLWLLIALMAANAAANVPLFRMRRLDLAFLSLLPYWALLAAFIWSVRDIDPVSLSLFALYSAYQVYAAAWGWSLWRLNNRRVKS
jgi:tryptophan-rich sensory protein